MIDPVGKHLPLKLGKLPARPDAAKFKLSTYIDTTVLPKPPRYFGHEAGVRFGMFGNDFYGDCVFAGAANETCLWCAETNASTRFTDAAVLSDYSALTGFDPNDPNSDGGTDMVQAASYRRKTGVVDASGTRHKIAAYLAIKPGSLTELFQATYLFGAVGIGIRFPASAMDQFNAGKPWGVVSGSPIEGGHYVAIIAKRAHLECVTWGRIQPLTQSFYRTYCDEALAYVSEESLVNNLSPEGFNAAQLLADLAALGR